MTHVGEIMSKRISIDARLAFDPTGPATAAGATGPVPEDSVPSLGSILSPGAAARWAVPRMRSFQDQLLAFYGDRLAWIALAVSAFIICYGGGAVLFWFHAIYLGEGGPAISPTAHWLLDSTAGLIGLTPAIALIMPFAIATARRTTPSGVLRPRMYALVAGALFAFVTAPGPLLHNALVGRGTWVANHVTKLIGNGVPPTTTPKSIPPLLDMSLQVLVALPLYIALMWFTLMLVRALVRAIRRREPIASLAGE